MTRGQPVLQRIASGDRSLDLDVLRGIAILFILMMNIPHMAVWATTPDWLDPRVPTWTDADRAAWWAVHFLDGTQRGLLELIFGAGIVIMTRVGESRAAQAGAWSLHWRRNVWLAAFGLFQGLVLLWVGDILLSYSVAALLAFPLRQLAPRRLLALGVAIVVAGQTVYIPEYLHARQVAAAAAAGDPAARAEWRARDAKRVPRPPLAAAERAARTGSLAAYASFMRGTWAEVQFRKPGLFFLNVFEAFAMMLIGMALWRLQVLGGGARASTYRWMVVGGYAFGVALRILAGRDALRFDAGAHSGDITSDLTSLAIVFGHVGAISLALRNRLGRKLLQPFVATGRMPLTTYLGANVLAATIFAGFGFGLWNHYGFAGFETIALAIILVQLAGANLWLRLFASGPLEWLWKSLAYRRIQPFSGREPELGAAITS